MLRPVRLYERLWILQYADRHHDGSCERIDPNTYPLNTASTSIQPTSRCTVTGTQETARLVPVTGIVNRFGELISPAAYYHAKVVGKSHENTISLYEGETVDVWVDIQNLGMWEWDSDTNLPPHPRDTASNGATHRGVADTKCTLCKEPSPPTTPIVSISHSMAIKLALLSRFQYGARRCHLVCRYTIWWQLLRRRHRIHIGCRTATRRSALF